MVEITPKNENGSITISHDVIANIAVTAALSVDGVVVPQEGQLTDFVLAKKYRGKPYRWIKIHYTDEQEIEITINIQIKNGFKVINVSTDVQQKVKQEVELMTGLSINTINVVALGVTQ